MMRTALSPTTSQKPKRAAKFVDHLIVSAWSAKENSGAYPFPEINRNPAAADTSLRPIQMGPGLLVYLDGLKKRRFLTEWQNAILQR